MHNLKLIRLGLEPEYIASDDEDFFNSSVKGSPDTQPNSAKPIVDNQPAPVVKIIVNTLSQNEFKELRIQQNSITSPSSSGRLIIHSEQQFGGSSPIVSVSNQGTPSHPTNDSDGVSDTLSHISFYAATATSSRSLCSCCTHPSEIKFVAPIFLPKGQKLLTDFFPVQKPIQESFSLCQEISLLIPHQFKVNFTNFIDSFKNGYGDINGAILSDPLLLTVYNCFKAIDIFSTLLIDLKMNPNFEINLSDLEGCGLLGGDSSTTAARSNYQNRQIISLDGGNDTEKDHTYAQNFFEKVRDTMLGAGNRKDFETFHSILLNFDFETETVPDLYYVSFKIKNHFLYIV